MRSALSLIVWLGLGLAAWNGYGQIGRDGKGLGKEGMDRPARGQERGGLFGTPDSLQADTARWEVKTYPSSWYRYIHPSREEDTLTVDTLLDIGERFRVNFTERDIFPFMPFQNIGQPLNRPGGEEPLSFRWRQKVRQGKLPAFLGADAVPVYHVPTPYSRLYYLSGNKQGQMLHSRIGINVRPHWYVGVGYRGLSSLGYYRHSISSHEFWYAVTEYFTPDRRYMIRAVLVKNHLENEENGGITDERYFEMPGDAYVDRAKIPVRLEDKSLWHSRQLRLHQRWRIKKDKERGPEAGYIFDYLKAYYAYESAATGVYGPLASGAGPADSTGMRHYFHQIYLTFRWKATGIRAALEWERHFITFDSTRTAVPVPVPRQNYFGDRRVLLQLFGKYTAVRWRAGGAYDPYTSLGSFSGEIQGWRGPDTLEIRIYAGRERAPFDMLVHQSRFDRFNWYHPDARESRMQAEFIYAGRWGRMKFRWSESVDPWFYGTDSLPHRYDGRVSVLAWEWEKDFSRGKWHFYPRIRYQTLDRTPALDLPAWIWRVAVYYKDKWFDKRMDMQAGITLRGFSSYYMDGFNPLVQSFFRQTRKTYGGFYLGDLFFDFKVKRFRAFLALEHFNALWERYRPRYYSAPYYPYADHIWRAAIVWEFVN
ncbi:MAG: putative porin [Chlorobi bacterium]|nr:putative porin [Chlorobiota bacterium]